MITVTREEAQQVLDKLENHWDFLWKDEKLIETLRARLAQHEKSDSQKLRDAGYTKQERVNVLMVQVEDEPEKEQEPVAWISAEETWLIPKLVISDKPKYGYKPVYTAPPQQQNQFNPDWDAMAVMVEEQQRMAKRIKELEAKLKEKNFDDYKVVNADLDSYSGVTYRTQEGIAVFSSDVVKWLLENKAGLYWEENRGN
jgi:hypothetical protein